MTLSEQFKVVNESIIIFLSCSQLDEDEVSRVLDGSKSAVLDS
jgi:hypothetical protein